MQLSIGSTEQALFLWMSLRELGGVTSPQELSVAELIAIGRAGQAQYQQEWEQTLPVGNGRPESGIRQWTLERMRIASPKDISTAARDLTGDEFFYYAIAGTHKNASRMTRTTTVAESIELGREASAIPPPETAPIPHIGR